ncbi:hypothetical protein QYE76_033498 [Lolium multiflorum]|uniref:Uncharacterized protein n=1 Tax=Lolium multiflorum TaxID=4521 RepID=A0AAD8QVD8_LOLMU|nr:hypothetical protein QYE76_033498 [Lolium multiflorum]
MDATSETLIPIQELVRKTTEKLEANFSKIGTMIHRFPRGLQFVSKHDRYIAPSFVALGPYHHGLPQLQEAEEVKHVAAHYFCSKSGHSIEEVYSKIVTIAVEARGCYADDVVARFGDAEFAAMMFLDGCFLLQYMHVLLQYMHDFMCAESALFANRAGLSTGPCMLRDIFMLENQLPWLVLEVLMTFTSVPVCQFVVFMASTFDAGSTLIRLPEDELKRYRPPHLLGFLRYYLIGNMPPTQPSHGLVRHLVLASSAIELAEIGIKLTASNKRWFDMSIQMGYLAGELSLTPLFLNDYTACWLVNMAAFEACTSTDWPSDGYTISSYISLLAMLMEKEDDVHELRTKHLVRSFFSNQEMLDLFKGLACHLRLGRGYFVVLKKIDDYKRHRPVRIVVHKFFYNYFKIIVALLSVTSVLVGIFKTLLSLKQN